MYAYINSALSICKIYNEMERERERERAKRETDTEREDGKVRGCERKIRI